MSETLITVVYAVGALGCWVFMLRELATDPSVDDLGRVLVIPVLLLPALAWPIVVALLVVIGIGVAIMRLVRPRSEEAPNDE